ncbi:hypothetical protein GCM10028820_33740 [Tessaracoccus terricola]
MRATLPCMAKTRIAPHLVLGGIGAALAVAGVVAFALSGSSSFGWFAYAPLAEQSWPAAMVLQPGHVWGLGLGIVGSLVISGVVGFRLGLRRKQ